MRIAMANDHAGFSLKQEIKHLLEADGHEVVDFGTPDTNVLCLGGKIIGSALALDIVRVWMSTAYLGENEEKYRRRVGKVVAIAAEHVRPLD